MDFQKLDKKVTSVMIPRGLAATLANNTAYNGIAKWRSVSTNCIFHLMTSVIITTIGLGSAKKIEPPEGSGGFVTENKG